PHLPVPGPRGRPADPPRLRPRLDPAGRRAGVEPRRGDDGGVLRHLRQLRRARPRLRVDEPLRAPVVDRRAAGAARRARAVAGAHRRDGPRRRRPPPLRDAHPRPAGDAGGMVGRALDPGSPRPQARRRAALRQPGGGGAAGRRRGVAGGGTGGETLTVAAARMSCRYRLVVFDWDGTLVDSIGSIVACTRAALVDAGLVPPPDEAIRGAVGLGLADTFDRYF